MIGNKSKPSPGDQLVASGPVPVPVVQFADDETAATVLNPIRQTYDNAVAYARQQQEQADAAQRDIDKWEQEIRDRRAWIERRELDRQAALQQVQRAQNAAKGAADTLAVLGAPVPPANGELSHHPDVLIDRIGAAHAEQAAAEGVRP